MAREITLKEMGPASGFVGAKLIIACTSHGAAELIKYWEPSERAVGRNWNAKKERHYKCVLERRAVSDLRQIAHAYLRDELRCRIARAFLVINPDRKGEETTDITDAFVRELRTFEGGYRMRRRR